MDFYIGNIKTGKLANGKLTNQGKISLVSHAEVRRCFREKLGATKYYNLISNGQGCKLINSSIDNQGNVMKLWETFLPDEMINKTVQFLGYECSSTGRIYNIYPPSQNCKTAEEAKKDTFQKQNLIYRHGDVGLKLLGYSERAIIET